MDEFPIYQIEEFQWVVDETMGTKARDWYDAREDYPDFQRGSRWLLKAPKRFSGEIWSEKIAYEIGKLMGLPIARVELANHKSESTTASGTISLNFADHREGRSLEHGNELMEAQSYRSNYYKDEENQIGLDAVYDYLEENKVAAPINAVPSGFGAPFFFTGYLVFDALIGNIDRHHQNWGVVRTSKGQLHLAPTFDHGACLGRELQARKRANYLRNKQVRVYATNKKGSAKIAPPGPNDRVVPFKVLDFLPGLGQDRALCFWLDRALNIDRDIVESLFDRFPPGIVEVGAQEFALQFLDFTTQQLRRLHEQVC